MSAPLRQSLLAILLLVHAGAAREFHVSIHGDDTGDGSAARPFRTISAAARAAQPGDTVTVHAGTYRERVTPPRGGSSESARIVYQAAPGEEAVIKGSEVVREWKPFLPGVWKLTLPNSFFGSYNPYRDLIAGDWFTSRGRPHHTGEVYLNGKSLYESNLFERVIHPEPPSGIGDPEGSTWTWFCESDERFTYLYANFHDRDPNRELVEINVRDSCFYPDQPGRDYITVRGFHMSQAATQWAAPTAEQIGLIGTHWSKGWIIENNVISDSKCVGITLGKDRKSGHNVWTADPSKDGAVHYNEVIARALAAGWSRQNIGSHIVRNNTITDCEQAGIAGSLGAVFSQIYGNHIHHIWTKRQFAGAEIAGIKIHAAIDVVIRNNRIHGAGRGLWMDWMAQGTRITANLLYDNSTDDLFVEVDHGPFLVDNNLFLSALSLQDWSEGGAYAHNLFGGRIVTRPEPNRSTPWHQPHATALAGMGRIRGGDDRFFNNVFTGSAGGLAVYDTAGAPLEAGGNLYLNGARPYAGETNPAIAAGIDARVEIADEGGGVWLRLRGLGQPAATRRVTGESLGKTRVTGLAYENADGSPVTVDRDYFGQPRKSQGTAAGPFENAAAGEVTLQVWK